MEHDVDSESEGENLDEVADMAGARFTLVEMSKKKLHEEVGEQDIMGKTVGGKSPMYIQNIPLT